MRSPVANSSDAQPNRILLVTIHQVFYPMTVDVLQQVFSRHGCVEKIVTFKKSAGQILSDLFLSLSFFSCEEHLRFYATTYFETYQFFLSFCR